MTVTYMVKLILYLHFCGCNSVVKMGSQILIVEDNLDILEAMQVLIESEGYSVTTASNGRKALEILMSVDKLPSLIFLDLMMPVMDGWAFAEEIFENKKLAAIPIVIVSAFSDTSKMPKNACEFLEKPAKFDKIFRIISQYCHK